MRSSKFQRCRIDMTGHKVKDRSGLLLYRYVDLVEFDDYAAFVPKLTGNGEFIVPTAPGTENVIESQIPERVKICNVCNDDNGKNCDQPTGFCNRYIVALTTDFNNRCPKCKRTLTLHKQNAVSKIRICDVRLQGHPTILEINRKRYYCNYCRRLTYNKDYIEGIQLAHHEKYSIRLQTSIVNLTYRHIRDDAYIAEGYGIGLKKIQRLKRDYMDVLKEAAQNDVIQNKIKTGSDERPFFTEIDLPRRSGKPLRVRIEMTFGSGDKKCIPVLVGISPCDYDGIVLGDSFVECMTTNRLTRKYFSNFRGELNIPAVQYATYCASREDGRLPALTLTVLTQILLYLIEHADELRKDLFFWEKVEELERIRAEMIDPKLSFWGSIVPDPEVDHIVKTSEYLLDRIKKQLSDIDDMQINEMMKELDLAVRSDLNRKPYYEPPGLTMEQGQMLQMFETLLRRSFLLADEESEDEDLIDTVLFYHEAAYPVNAVLSLLGLYSDEDCTTEYLPIPLPCLMHALNSSLLEGELIKWGSYTVERQPLLHEGYGAGIPCRSAFEECFKRPCEHNVQRCPFAQQWFVPEEKI